MVGLAGGVTIWFFLWFGWCAFFLFLALLIKLFHLVSFFLPLYLFHAVPNQFNNCIKLPTFYHFFHQCFIDLTVIFLLLKYRINIVKKLFKVFPNLLIFLCDFSSFVVTDIWTISNHSSTHLWFRMSELRNLLDYL